MKEATYEMASLISFGSKDMHVRKYVQLAWGKIVDAKYNMAKLVDLA